MLKKVFLAVALSFAVAGVTMTAAPAPAEAGHFFHCFKKAHTKYGHQWKKRRAYRKACNAKHRAYHKGNKGPFKNVRLFKKAA
jgi:hypothetical protein